MFMFSSSSSCFAFRVGEVADLVRAEIDEEMKANREAFGEALVFSGVMLFLSDLEGVEDGLSVSLGEAGPGSQELRRERAPDSGDLPALVSPVKGMSIDRGLGVLSFVGEGMPEDAGEYTAAGRSSVLD